MQIRLNDKMPAAIAATGIDSRQTHPGHASCAGVGLETIRPASASRPANRRTAWLVSAVVPFPWAASVTSRGGAGEFVQDGINGYLREPDDVEGMTAAVLELLEDEPRRQQMAEDARRDAAADFGAPCVIKKYLSLYDRLLATDVAGLSDG